MPDETLVTEPELEQPPPDVAMEEPVGDSSGGEDEDDSPLEGLPAVPAAALGGSVTSETV